MTSKRLGATAVVDEKRRLKGIITDGDLRRMLNNKNTPVKVTAASIMSTNPRTVDKNCYATQALAIMQQNNITQLIVTEDDRVLGFIHLHDLLKEGII